MNSIPKLSALVFFLFLNIHYSFSQVKLAELKDFSSLNVDQLSDYEIRNYLQYAKESGMPESDILAAMSQKGLSQEQAEKFKLRIAGLGQSDPTAASTVGHKYEIPQKREEMQESGLDPLLFGSELFTSTSTVFEPNLRIPAPSSYLLGPDDELVINVFGLSEKNYQLTISNEGQIYIPNVGPVNISGFTLERATALIRAKLIATIYSSLASGKTQLQVSLGKIKSIRVTVIGQARRTGTYTVSSLSTLFNVLYLCGGPSQMGSFRQIELIRENKVFRSADLYQFLLSGDQSQNILLQEGDIIRIPYSENVVKVSGSVKRKGKYEMSKEESISQLLKYCGGFDKNAFRKSIGLSSLTENGRVMRDVAETEFDKQTLRFGDEIQVNSIMDRYLNRVAVFGFVRRPGFYELNSNMQVADLIEKAGGLLPEAFGKSASLFRKGENQIPEILSVDLDSVIKHQKAVMLKNEDSLYVSSIFDFKENLFVTVNGFVQRPMTIAWRENLSVYDVINEAGGIRLSGDSGRVEISRRLASTDVSNLNHPESEIIPVNLNLNFPLKPFDIISVRNNPGNVETREVLVTGEVKFPGRYVLQRNGERLTDILGRAGRFRAAADSNYITIRRRKLSGLGAEDRESMFQRLLGITQDSLNTNTRLKNELLKDYEIISVDKKYYGNSYESPDNLVLEDGDMIIIEKNNKLVKVSGEVFYPTILTHVKGRSAKYYLKRSGGFSKLAYKRGVMVIYPNAKARTVKNYLFFKKYPAIKERCEIFVPQQKEKESKKMTYSEMALIVTSMGILANIFIAVFK